MSVSHRLSSRFCLHSFSIRLSGGGDSPDFIAIPSVITESSFLLFPGFRWFSTSTAATATVVVVVSSDRAADLILPFVVGGKKGSFIYLYIDTGIKMGKG